MDRQRPLVTLIAATILSIVLSPICTTAQTTSGIEQGVQFDFSLPGARSLGMGGSFVSVADDASASQANPAGLIILSKPEVSFEARGWNFYTLIPDTGHAYGSPTNIGVDTVSGLHNAEFKDTTFSPALLSFVIPYGQWAFAGFRQQIANLRNHQASNGPFLTLLNGVDVSRFNPTQGELDLDIVSYGGSVARRFGGRLSLGASVNINHFDYAVSTEAFTVLPHAVIVPPGQRSQYTGAGQQFGPTDFSDANAIVAGTQAGSDWALSVTAGFLLKPNEQWSIGGSVRQGPTFEYSSRFGTALGIGRVIPGATPTELQSDEGIQFHVPDAFSLGVAYQPVTRLLVVGQYDRVQYRQLINGSGDGRPVETTGKFSAAADAQARLEGLALINNLTIDNANQLRVGAEWLARTGPNPLLLLRVGTWFDPDHKLRFDNPDPSNQILRQYEISIPGGEDEMHFATGLGLAFPRFRIDAGIDLSPRINTFSASTVFYWR